MTKHHLHHCLYKRKVVHYAILAPTTSPAPTLSQPCVLTLGGVCAGLGGGRWLVPCPPLSTSSQPDSAPPLSAHLHSSSALHSEPNRSAPLSHRRPAHWLATSWMWTISQGDRSSLKAGTPGFPGHTAVRSFPSKDTCAGSGACRGGSIIKGSNTSTRPGAMRPRRASRCERTS